jgi:hypothetical protein
MYTPRCRRYKKPPPRPPMALPTLAASGDPIPCPPTRKPEEKEKGERRRRTEAPGAAPPAAKPEPPARRTRTRGSQARLRPPASSASPSPRRRSVSPTSAASFLVTAPHTSSPTPALRPVATQVRTPFLLPCGRHGHRAEAEPPPHHAAAPPLVMPAIEPDWVAIFCRCRRLRRRARHPPSLSPLAVGRRPVLSPPHRVGAPASRPRRVRVRARARAGRGARTQACTPARVRRSLEGMAGPLAPFSCLRRRSPPCLGRPRRRDPAVVFWDARTVAKRKKRRVLGRRFLTRVLAPECGRLVHRRPWRRTGLHSALRRAAPLWPAPNLSPCRTPCVRAHPGARPCARVHAPPPREGTRTPTERRHRAGVVAPTPAPTSP